MTSTDWHWRFLLAGLTSFSFSILLLLRICARYMAREEDGDDDKRDQVHDVRRGQVAFQEHDVLKRQLSRASALPRSRKVHRHQGASSGMKAFFLGAGGSGGTGVFLPCGTGHRSGCSTVLIPAGVAQALRLHFDRISTQFDPGAVGGFPIQPAISLPKRISDGKKARNPDGCSTT